MTRQSLPRGRGLRLLAFLLVPAALFPLVRGLLALQDTIGGDAELLHEVLYGTSRRAIAELFLRDWLAALPVLYGLCLLAAFALLQVQRRLGNRPPWQTAIAGAVLGVLIAAWLGAGASLVLAISGAVAVGLLGLAARPAA